MSEKKLYRSKTNKMLAGICGGIGEYFSVDPTIVRIIFVLLGFTTTGILLYLVCIFIMPENNEYN